MSLHLGNDFVISTKQVLAILNVHKNASPHLLQMLDAKQGTERIRKIGTDRILSAVLSNKGTYYLSPVEASTLARRFASSTVRFRNSEGKYGKKGS